MVKLIKKIYDFVIKLIGKEMFMYLVFGFLTTAINFIAYYVCNIIFKINAGISTTIAFILGVIFAYITNKIWVFESKTNTFKELITEIISFGSARMITYFLDLILMIIFVDKLNFNSLITKLVVNILVVILNYIFSKLMVFNKNINFINIIKKYYLYLLYLIYIIFLFILMIKHEPWRDEAQSYLIVRDLDIFSLFKILKYEGHPFLYYIIIYISKYLGYRTVNIISYILSIISTYLILFKSKCNKIISFILLFSYSYIFCSIYGRSYSLILLLIILISLLYKNRNNNIIIFSILVGLLFNTHILVFGFCIGIMLVQIYDYIKLRKKNILIGILIEILSVLLLMLQLIGASSMSNLNIEIKEFFLSGLRIFSTFNCNIIFGYIFLIIFILMLAYFLFKNKKIFIILILGFIFITCVDAYIFKLNLYHSCIILMFMTFCLLNDDGIIFKILYLSIICLIFNYSINYIKNEILYDYTDASNVSKYFMEQEDKNGNILCMYDDLCTSIIPYLKDSKYKFLAYNRSMREYTYVLRNSKSTDKFLYNFSLDNIDYVICPKKYENIYEPFLESMNGLSKEYETTNKIIGDESYIVYKVIK